MSQILLQQHKTFSQLAIQGMHKYKPTRFSLRGKDNERCFVGMILSELGWNGRYDKLDDGSVSRYNEFLIARMKFAERYGKSITTFNDEGYSWSILSHMMEDMGE